MAHFFTLLYISVIILQPQEWIKIFDGRPLQEITLLLGIMSAVAFESKRFKDVLFSNPSKLFLVFIVVIVVSCAGEGQAYAFGKVGFMYVKFYLCFLLVVVVNNSDQKIKKTFNVIILCGVIVGYHCINLYHFGVEIGHGIGETAHTLNWRGSVQWLGTFHGTNTTGLLMLVPLALSIAFLYTQPGFSTKLYYLFTTAVIGYAFILTHSRGGFVGLMAILGYLAWLKTRIRLKYFLPMALVLGLAAMILKPHEEGRGISESSTPERIELLYQGLQMFKQYPIIGIGTGQFAHNNPVRKTAHNIYLLTLAENGFIGLFLFILMYYLPIRELFKLNQNKEKEIAERRQQGEPKDRKERRRWNQEIAETQNSINLSIASLMVLGGFACAVFFLSARHEVPILAFAFVTAVAMNNKMDFNVSKREIKLVVSVMSILVVVVYVAIQAFFALFR